MNRRLAATRWPIQENVRPPSQHATGRRDREPTEHQHGVRLVAPFELLQKLQEAIGIDVGGLTKIDAIKTQIPIFEIRWYRLTKVHDGLAIFKPDPASSDLVGIERASSATGGNDFFAGAERVECPL